MKDRQIIEWDKDDVEALKFMKVDILALGMLTCMAKPSISSASIRTAISTCRRSSRRIRPPMR